MEKIKCSLVLGSEDENTEWTKFLSSLAKNVWDKHSDTYYETFSKAMHYGKSSLAISWDENKKDIVVENL